MKKLRKSRSHHSRNQKAVLPGWILFLKKYYLAALIVLLLPVIVGTSIGGVRTNQSRAQDLLSCLSCGFSFNPTCWAQCAVSSVSSGTLPGIPGGGTLPGNLPGGLPGLPPELARFAPCVNSSDLMSCVQNNLPIGGGLLPDSAACLSKCVSDPVSCLTSCLPGGIVGGSPGGNVVNNTPVPVRSTPIPTAPVNNNTCASQGGFCTARCSFDRNRYIGQYDCQSPSFCCKPYTSSATAAPRVTRSLNIPSMTAPNIAQPVASSGKGTCTCTCTGAYEGCLNCGIKIAGTCQTGSGSASGAGSVNSKEECNINECLKRAPGYAQTIGSQMAAAKGAQLCWVNVTSCSSAVFSQP